jgi:hypothetical protein
MGKQQAERGSGRRMTAVSLSNLLMAIESVFVHANEITPLYASQSIFPTFQECDVGCDAPIRRPGIT